MSRNRIIGYFLTLATTLFLASCIHNTGPSLAPSEKENNQILNVNPIVITIDQNSGKTSLDFHCYEKQDCYESITLPSEMEWLFPVVLNQDGMLFIPIRTRIQNKANSVGFILLNKTSHNFVTTPITGFSWYDEVSQVVFFKNKMIFTISGDPYVYILDETGKTIDILLDKMASDSSALLRKGSKENIIVVGTSVKKQNNGSFADIRVIDLQTYNVESKLIPGPESAVLEYSSTPAPGTRYNIQVDGITDDMQMLYYEYFGLNDRMQLSNQLNFSKSQI